MENKELQRQRMMTYFMDAAKEIIRKEGVRGLTARKVGEKAGYSYATIYNYFSDLNTLLAYCVFDFLEDCYKYLLSFKNDSLDSKEQIITYSLEYFKYFHKNPDMFQLIFIEVLGKSSEALMRNNKPSVNLLLKESITRCAKEGYLPERNIQLIQELIGSSIHGKLLYFLKRRNMEELNDILASIKNEIEFLINCKEVRL